MKEKIIAEGKTKRILKLENHQVEIQSKDDITAGDGEKRDVIENKAVLANNTTCNIFELLKRCGLESDIHYIKRISNRSFLAHECEMIPIEVVIRRIATGSYLKRNPQIKEGTVFDNLIVEFFFKDDAFHDPFIVRSEDMKDSSKDEWLLCKPKEPTSNQSILKTIKPICDRGEAKYVTARAKKIFLILEEAWRKQDGVVLYDLKIEFGRYTRWKHKILLADVIDNDSWRIRTKDGQQLDKQVYRDGGKLEEVKNKYELVSKLTNSFCKIKIEI
jgi:phosphoribosylaminoimidazole-succinocarboxamide synthase